MQKQVTAMAVLASEQIIPNLEGLLSLHSEETPVTHLFIYHTNDLERSAKPAHRIKQMTENFFSHLNVTLHKPAKDEDGKEPNLVTRAISRWFDSVQPEHLIINATGGLKTMFAGALRLSHSPTIRVIYRDLDATWLELVNTGGALISKKIEINRHGLDVRIKKLGILNLVKIQSGFYDIHSTQPRKIECVKALEQAINQHWNWSLVAPENESSGIFFEHWFASLIATFEVDDLLVGLEPHDKARAQMETDIWVLKKSQLYMFDLKLISSKQKKSSLAEQITNASAQAEKFAGINVKTILIRPGYSFTQTDAKSLKKLAARFSCDIWFQEDMPVLLTRLQGLFKQQSSEQENLAPLLKAAQSNYGFLFSDPDFFASIFKSEQGKSVINIDQIYNKLNSQNYKWIGVKSANNHYIFHISKVDEQYISFWVHQLKKHHCNAEKIGRNQLLVIPINEMGQSYLKKYRAGTTMQRLLPV